MKRVAVWSGFAGVLVSYMIGIGCSSSDSNPGGSGAGGDSSDGGSAPTGGSNPGTGSTSGGGTGGSGGSSGGADSTGGMGGEAMGGFGGAMGGSAGASAVNQLENPGFEEGNADKESEIPGWEESGDIVASYIEASGSRTGWHKLGHWTDSSYEVSTHQTVMSIPNGTYTFSVWVMRGASFDEQYLFARDYGGAEMTQSTSDNASDSAYVEVELSGIEVTNNQVTVGIYSAGPAGSWANFDDAVLIQE